VCNNNNERKQTGKVRGDEGAKIVHWNCRTLRDNLRNNLDKMHLIDNLNAMIISLNETNGQLRRWSRYNIFEAIPRQTRRANQRKFNAALLIIKGLKVEVIKKKVNYVSCVVSDPESIGQ